MYPQESIRPTNYIPLNFSTLEQAERLPQKNDVAAFVMAPSISNIKILIPDPNFLKSLDQLCKQHVALLVLDEMVTGF